MAVEHSTEAEIKIDVYHVYKCKFDHVLLIACGSSLVKDNFESMPVYVGCVVKIGIHFEQHLLILQCFCCNS